MRQLFFKKLILTSALATLLSASLGYADCPPPAQIERQQLGSQGYYWVDGPLGWVGYTKGTDNHDTAVAEFNHAIWWDYHNATPTALCFYVGNKGSIIEMSETNWDRLVQKPAAGQTSWSPYIFESYPAESCWADIKTCGFSYY